MIKNTKKYNTIIIIILSVSLFISACSRNNSGEDAIDGNKDSSFIDSFIYLPNQIELPGLSFPINGMTIHDERIYFWYTKDINNIAVESMDVDGRRRQETHLITNNIDESPSSAFVGGLRVTDSGEFVAIKHIANNVGNIVMSLNTYNPQGEEISKKILTEITTPDEIPFMLEQVVFTNDGNIAIIVSGSFSDKAQVYLYDIKGIFLGQLFINIDENITTLHDGRAVALNRSDSEMSLREINFATGDWGASIRLSDSTTTQNMQRILSAGSNHKFDLLVDDGNYLYGYCLETNTITPIINWIESNIKIPHHLYHLVFIDEDSFALLYTEFVFTGNSHEILNDLFILSSMPREEMPERTIITLGGLGFSDDIRTEVIAFNRENQDYQIQLKDYLSYGDWDAAVLRFNTEMITGRGPDMNFTINSHLEENGFMADLYTFIDADPDIERSDFFPNVLQIQEASDGTLPFISNGFFIRTMIALREVAEKIEPFTFESLLKRLDESNTPYLINTWMLDKNVFLSHSLHLSGNSFIDFNNNTANFDSEEFIKLLEICADLPIQEMDGSVNTSVEDNRFRYGEQLLRAEFISYPNQIRDLQERLGDIVAIGMPTTKGGQHVISESPGIGINASSEHKEAAWSFIRRLLLPEAVLPDFTYFYLRIDKFEELITELMTPIIVDGEEQLQPSLDIEHSFFAMTEEDAAEIREIVTSASIRHQFDDIVWTIVQEDVQPFFAGIRSAEEAARIIQNRVQRYLDERS